MKSFRVWRDGETQEDGIDYDAYSPDNAAERMARDDFEEEYFESADFWVRDDAGDVKCMNVRIEQVVNCSVREDRKRVYVPTEDE